MKEKKIVNHRGFVNFIKILMMCIALMEITLLLGCTHKSDNTDVKNTVEALTQDNLEKSNDEITEQPGGMSCGFSPAMQNQLAKKLHIDEEDTSIINKSVSNNGITMSVVSSHVAKNTAVVMLDFTKDSEETFGNCLNPDIKKLTTGNKTIEKFMLVSELSEDKKTLYCYFTWHMDEPLDGKAVMLNVEKLYCNESQVDGKTFSDQIIDGKWSLDFVLEANTDNTITCINSNLSKTVSMCGKELQINSVVIADLQVIVNTTTLSEGKIPVDVSSSVSSSSGMYYGVYVTVVYEDGSQSKKMNCKLDENNNIIAYYFNTLIDKKIKEVRVKDIVIK